MPLQDLIATVSPRSPVLIAGPTASGKSALALALAQAQGGVIVNADALQLWSCWRVISARPDPADEARAPHLLYGCLAPGDEASVGHWLRLVAPILDAFRAGGPRPILVGGTGLYLSALTEGLARIPPVPAAIRAEATALLALGTGLSTMLHMLDAPTRARLDTRNPMRVSRAWEVLRATGRGLADWQADTGPALLPPAACTRLQVVADRDWLAHRIDRRFAQMVGAGALDEARAALPGWDPVAPWAKAIGAPELIAHLRGETDLATAVALGQAATRQYAKRQRSWFRARMRDWHPLDAQALAAAPGPGDRPAAAGP
ncbi:tRNA (adenosine(37)-N6)-dimethylallyltransferase MiaA [Frigidibacter sp. MR17.24]|uniref:tRNA (adenosine(37)-N6)-dimethylallyltransferase MiaA n=1 Tax=Frigidibacter sp. MR17.24 TaxID=3127345 RepID=UPI003012BF9D